MSMRSCIDLAVAAEAAHFIVPGANGGDIVKLGAGFKKDVRTGAILASIVVDRASGLFGLLIVGCIAGGLDWSNGSSAVRHLTQATIAILGLFVVMTLLILGSPTRNLLRQLSIRWNWSHRLMDKIDYIIHSLHSIYPTIFSAVALSVCSQVLTLSALFYVGAALNPSRNASWGTVLLAGPWVLICTALPLPFGALGVTEQLSEEMFRILGYSGGGMTTLGYRLVLTFSTAVLVGSWVTFGRLFLATSLASVEKDSLDEK